MIKKHKNKNNYWMNNGIFVRDLTKENCVSKDINYLYEEKDYEIILENESINQSKKYMIIDHESIYHQKILIISDGLNFETFHQELYKIKNDVAIIAVNGALKKWKLVGKNCPEEKKRAITYYVVNNPYDQCSWYLPKDHTYFPKCIASTKTNYNFLNKYQGIKYLYFSSNDDKFSGLEISGYRKFDDYRNPICAALSLAYSFNPSKIAILGSDECFTQEKPSSIKVNNELFCYPQQIKSNLFIDGMCYWLSKQNISIVNNSEGTKLNNSEYIKNEDLVNFFED